MAPLPSNTTGVVFLDYNTCDEPHTVQCRYGASSDANGAMTVLDAFLTALSPVLNLVTIVGARERVAGGNVSLPLTWLGSATYGSGAGPHNESAYYYDFVGRSADGRRVRMAMFGAGGDHDGIGEDFRFSVADSSDIAAAFAVLAAAGADCVSISGLPVSWHPYANGGVNAYWRNRIR